MNLITHANRHTLKIFGEMPQQTLTEIGGLLAQWCMLRVSGLLSVHAVLCCSSYSAAVDCSFKTADVTDTECGMGGIVQAQVGKDCISEL